MYEKFGQFIDGNWSPSSNGETYEVINPATEEVLGKASKASPEDVDRALKSASKGLEVWKKTAPWQRSYIIRRIADKMREKQSSDEKALRNRYDQVIKKYDDERQHFQKQKNELKLEVVSLISDSTSRLERFQKIVSELSDLIKSQNFMIIDQNRVLEKSNSDLKEVSVKLESCLKLITDMISDQKIRDAANAAAKNQFSSIIQSKD